jgi:hypothetical protein
MHLRFVQIGGIDLSFPLNSKIVLVLVLLFGIAGSAQLPCQLELLLRFAGVEIRFLEARCSHIRLLDVHLLVGNYFSLTRLSAHSTSRLIATVA